MWRAGLPALGCEAPLKPENSLCLTQRGIRFYDCCAAERGQAHSPQGLSEQHYPIFRHELPSCVHYGFDDQP